MSFSIKKSWTANSKTKLLTSFMEQGGGKEEEKGRSFQMHISLSKCKGLHHLYRYQRLSKGFCHSPLPLTKGSYNVHSCDAFPGNRVVATASPNS